MREADTFIAIHRRRPMHRIIEIISIDVSDRTRNKMAFLPDKITFVGFFESFFPDNPFYSLSYWRERGNLKIRIFILKNSLFFYPKNTLFIFFSSIIYICSLCVFRISNSSFSTIYSIFQILIFYINSIPFCSFLSLSVRIIPFSKYSIHFSNLYIMLVLSTCNIFY